MCVRVRHLIEFYCHKFFINIKLADVGRRKLSNHLMVWEHIVPSLTSRVEKEKVSNWNVIHIK